MKGGMRLGLCGTVAIDRQIDSLKDSSIDTNRLIV